MSARKKKKLSLKKAPVPKPGDDKQNTILSLFKKQREKQVINIESDVAFDESKDGNKADTSEKLAGDGTKHIEDEGSEGDVVITKVENSASESVLKKVKASGSHARNLRKNLSLTKAKKRKNPSDSEDSDNFMPNKSKYFETNNSTRTENSQTRYNLRKCKTDPVIETSDSEDEMTAFRINSKVIGAKTTSSQKENLECTKHIEKTETPVLDKVKRNETRSKLSLKKYKTESDAASKVRKVDAKVETSAEKIVIYLSEESDSESKHDLTSKEYSRDTSVGSSSNPINDKETCPKSENDMDVLETNGNQTDLANIATDSRSKPAKAERSPVDIHNTNAKPSNTICEDRKDNNDTSKAQTDTEFQENKTPELNRTATYSIFKLQKLKNDNKDNSAKAEQVVPETVHDRDESDDSKADFLQNVEETISEATYKVPYYLENFKTILDTVLNDTENSRLFDETDMKYVTNFKSLDEAAQKLYVRLFSRRLAWLPLSKISYPEISDDMESLTDKLVDASLLISGEELADVSQILKAMSAPDLKALAKPFHLNITGATKKQIITMLIKKSQQSSISSMFKGGGNVSTEKTMITRAKSYVGKMYRLQDESRAVFIRTLMLFSLYNTNLDEESGSGGQNQLFQMLMANIGRVVYPSYTVNRQKAVFKDRAALKRFETALMFELEIQSKTEKNKWTEAFEVYQQAKEIGKDVCSNKEYLKWDSALPLFLRSYTAGTIYTRIDNQGVEILQRLKKYKEAVQLLEELLSQALYCPEYRGHWYDRLALNLDAHLKTPKKSLEVIKTGLVDPEVRPSRRYLLYQRAEKICGSPNSKYASQLADIEPVRVTEAPEHYVDGMVMPDAGSAGLNYKFVLEGGEDGVTLCAVEELALEHYKQNGYPEGLHAEGSIISNLFLMFFWDIEFMDIPDVFQGPYQTQPLDMMSTDFYASRRQHVDERLEWLRTSDTETLVSEVGEIWEKHNGTMCTGINWEKFLGPQKLQCLVTCMGGRIIAGILERYVKDPRHTRSGFPDLTLWNTENKTFKISEVKGPGDRLSHKQILWLDYLLGLGVDAEVCYVKAVGSKKLKPSTRT